LAKPPSGEGSDREAIPLRVAKMTCGQRFARAPTYAQPQLRADPPFEELGKYLYETIDTRRAPRDVMSLSKASIHS
jgi:hypothetical protein